MPRKALPFALTLRHVRSLCLVMIAAAGSAVAAAGSAPAQVSRRVAVMGTWVLVETGAGDQEEASEAAEAAVRALEAADARLSTWRDDTPLAALNRAPAGSRVNVGPRLAAELSLALHWWRRTGGAFNPAVGPLVAAWDLRGAGARPGSRELAAARAACDPSWLEVAADGAVRRDARMVLEEGGWGKGAALDAAVVAAGAAGATWVLVNAGGQVAGTGPLAAEVADPADRSRPAFRVLSGAGSLATTGNGGRRWTEGHILDPRTGRPARDFGSVTVWAASAFAADALSTALFVMGPDEGLRWALREPGVEAVFVVRVGEQLTVRSTPGLDVGTVSGSAVGKRGPPGEGRGGTG